MTTFRSINFMVVALLLSAACSKPIPQTTGLAGEITLIVNADVVTMNEDQPSAEAIAFRGGRILAIGTEQAVRQEIGNYSRFFDLNARTVFFLEELLLRRAS